ncbi:MAG: tetratricopeptide repeat protein [Sulfurovum sp.]|nr:tetratricopeptide repeat protein [Sulfurovum sp.]
MLIDHKKEYDKAIASYEKAIEINPKYDEAYCNMGNAYHHKKEYDKAIASYQKYLQINPNNSLAYSNLFELQLTQDEPFDEVLESKYSELFQNKKEIFIQYEMLKILETIHLDKVYSLSLDEWKQKYDGVSLGSWGWDEIDTWMETIEDSTKKAKLLEAVEVFKKQR